MHFLKTCLIPLLFCLCLTLHAAIPEKSPPTLIVLKGYLGKQEITQAEKKLKEASQQNGSIVIEVNSNAADMSSVLEFVKALYMAKLEHASELTVYIDDQALGPAAIIPFLADSLYISPIASWGDITLGSENVIPSNILGNQVAGLIPPQSAHLELLQALCMAMIDKSAKLIGQPEIKRVEGQALVINQQQMRALKLPVKTLTLEQFNSSMQLKAEQTAVVQVAPISNAAAIFAKGSLEELKQHIHYQPEGPHVIGRLIIEDHDSSINQATWLYVKNGLDYYKKVKPLFVILELNTPGGEVFAAQKISDALKEFDTQYNIPVVCYINNWAISAGAMLAYSCRFIAVTKDGTMGAAEPVIMGENNELVPASEKVNSALRADFASRARFFDRNPYIAEAMVDKDMILVVRHGEVLPLDNESQIRTQGPDPDILLSPKGKLLTLNAEQLLKYGVANLLLLPQKTGELTDAERESGRWPASKTLLFHAPFFNEIPDASIDTYQMDWKSRFFAFLASPMISSLLLLGLLLGFYVELSTPGFGFAGALGVICLILIILSSFALEIANWLEVILLLVGLLILLVDLFVLPTFGLFGFAGLLFFIAGLFGLLLPGLGSIEYEVDTKTFNAAGQMVLERVVWFSLTLLLGGAIIAILARFLPPSLSAYSSLILKGNEQEASKGFIAVENPKLLPTAGAKGEVVATLRPSGKVLIGQNIYEALSQGDFVEKGEKVTVVGLEGSVLLVQKSNQEKPTEPTT